MIKRWWQWLGASTALIGVLGLSVILTKTDAWLYYQWQMQCCAPQESTQALGLSHYRVVIDALPVAGVDADLSGLTFNPHSQTLLSVINGEPLVVELSSAGQLLRQIPVEGAVDMEGITHIRDMWYVIADERENRLFWVEITPTTSVIDLQLAPQITLDLAGRRNKGFEGVSWDEHGQRLLIVQERNPIRVLELSGFQKGMLTPEWHLRQIAPSQIKQPKLRDLSSITHSPQNANLLLLSDESRLVVEYDPTGRILGYLSLWRGSHGLNRSIPQAEGLAIGDDLSVYIVSEPNLFYRFKKTNE